VGRTLAIPTPRAFLPLQQPKRYKGAFGGRGSGKSHFFAAELVRLCIARPPLRAVCVRETQKSLEQSVKRLVEDKIKAFGVGHYFRVMATHIDTPRGGIVVFQGMRDYTAESIKSLEGFDLAWVEEAHMLSQRSLDLLRPTIRKDGSELWFSWNPHKPTDPVETLLRGPDRVPDAIVVKANFEDNPWFPEALAREMEWDRRRDPEKHAHVWGGGYQKLSAARVFKNWRIEEFDTPKDATFYHGGDWGFAEDPTCLVRCFLKGKQLFVDAEAYEIGCEIEDTPALFDSLVCGCQPPERKDCKHPLHGLARRWVSTADSARPETISYMRRHGYPNMVAARKGPGSVEEGVAFLKGYDIVVHPRCRHTADELASYSYKTDPLSGLVLPVLEEKKNHIIDSLRYAIEPVRKPTARMVDVIV